MYQNLWNEDKIVFRIKFIAFSAYTLKAKGITSII